MSKPGSSALDNARFLRNRNAVRSNTSATATCPTTSRLRRLQRRPKPAGNRLSAAICEFGSPEAPAQRAQRNVVTRTSSTENRQQPAVGQVGMNVEREPATAAARCASRPVSHLHQQESAGRAKDRKPEPFGEQLLGEPSFARAERHADAPSRVRATPARDSSRPATLAHVIARIEPTATSSTTRKAATTSWRPNCCMPPTKANCPTRCRGSSPRTLARRADPRRQSRRGRRRASGHRAAGRRAARARPRRACPGPARAIDRAAGRLPATAPKPATDRKSLDSTPITVNGRALNVSARPSTCGSPPRRSRQKRCVTTTTAGSRSARASLAVNPRPIAKRRTDDVEEIGRDDHRHQADHLSAPRQLTLVSKL